jgi:hypothetical protein
VAINNYQPISFKYLTGWGGELADATNTANATAALAAGASLDDIKKLLRKQTRRDRENLRDRWKKLYSFYAGELLDEQTQAEAQTDGYLKSLDHELNLD